MWDVFVSHASQDKEDVARPLAEALQNAGLKVWYDEFELVAGSSLRKSIDEGLANSRFGIVVLSPDFFAKSWAQRELAGLIPLAETNALVPIWHNISASELHQHSPLLADLVAIRTSDGMEHTVKELLRATNIVFSGSGITGSWFGPTGRLRLFEVGELIEGDYDWNGYDWKAHLRGHINQNVFSFEWWWDFTRERGAGCFRFDGQTLDGEWWIGQLADGEYVGRNEIAQTKNSWGFRRVDEPQIET